MRLQRYFIHLLCLLVFPTTASADVEFYTYGGFRPIVNAFTNLAVIFDSEDYLVFGFVVSIIGVTVGMLVKSGLAALGKATSKDALAILFLAMFGTALFGALFEPKTTVHIYDPTQNQYESVGDIPLALAFIASGTNLLERFATDTVSDGIGFGRTRHANGKSLELMFNILGTDPVSHNIYISKSIERYFKGCVVPAAANSGTFSGFNYNAVLNGTADIWTELARTRDSDQRFLWFDEANPGGIVMNCEDGYDNIRDTLQDVNTFSTFIRNACVKSGYEDDPLAIDDCRDLIEETTPLIFSGSVLTSPESISAMATLANGLYMTLAETPGSAITSIGNMKQMSQGYGSTIIAEGWLPSMRSATLVIILSFTPLIILMIFTPFVFRALHMLSALFLFLTIWGASDAIIHVVIVDNVMSMMSEIKTYEGGLRSFLTAPSELQKSIAMFGKMQSLGVMFAGLMTAFYFKFSSMQFANMGEKLSNDIDSTGQQVGNEVINPINRMETMRQAASSAGHYNLMSQVGPELMGTAIQQTATWSDSTNANYQKAMGELGFSPQQAITMRAQNGGGEVAGSVSARNDRAISTGTSILDTSTNMSRVSQLSNDGKVNYDQTQMSRLEGSHVDQSNMLANINNADTTGKINYSNDAATHERQSEIALNERYGSGDATWNKGGQTMAGVHQLGMENTTTNLESVAATRISRENAVNDGYGSSTQDVANTVADVGTSSSIGTNMAWNEAVEKGIVENGKDASKQQTSAGIRTSTASNKVAEYIGNQTGRGELGQEVENQKFNSESIAALSNVRALASQVEEESSFNIAKEQNSKIDKAMTTDDLRSWNSLHPGEFQQPFPGTVSMVVDTDEPNSTPTNISYATGDQDTYSSDVNLYKDIGNTIKTGTDEEIAGIVNTANTEPKLMNMADSLIAARAVSRSAQESESSGTEVKGGASAGIYGNIPVSAIPVIGPLISGAQKATQIVSKAGTTRGKSKGLDAGVSARANVGVGGSSTDTSSDTGTVNVNRGQAVDDIVSLQKSLQNEDSNARTQAIAAFREKYSKDIADDLEYQKAVTQKSDPAMMDDYKSGLTGDISQMMESAREFTENVQNGVDDLTNKITDFVGNESVKR